MGLIKWMKEKLEAEKDETAFNIITKKYYYITWVSGMYPRLKRLWLLFTIIQIIVFIALLILHLGIIIQSLPAMTNVNFVLFSQLIHYMGLMTVGLTVLVYLCFFRRENLSRFHKVINKCLYDYKEDKGEVYEYFAKKMQKEWIQLLAIPALVSVASGMVMLLGPVVDQYGTYVPTKEQLEIVSFNLPVPAKYPWDTGNTYIYLLTIFGQVSAGCITALVIATGGLFYICFTQTVTRELFILLHATDNLESRARDMHLQMFGFRPPKGQQAAYSSSSFIHCVNLCMVKLHQHYVRILR